MLSKKSNGPKIPANFSTTAKNPKNSPDRSRGIRLANSDRLSAWLPPWTIPTSTASTKKCADVVMNRAEDADPRVNHQREQDRPLGAEPARQRPEEERERDAQELHEHQRRRSSRRRPSPISRP